MPQAGGGAVYRTTRRIHTHPSQLQQALALVGDVVKLVNERHGGNLGIAVNVGGDPGALVIVGTYEHLSDYEAMRAATVADTDIQALVAGNTNTASSIEDTISKVLVPGGEPKGWVIANAARMHMPRVVEAIGLGVEIAEYVTKLTGVPVSFSNATTGDRSRVMWSSTADSMADIEALGDQTEGDAGYLDFFARSAGLFVDGSLHASIWQRVG
jgi:hypothetical protein